jgi:hypothetical protein
MVIFKQKGIAKTKKKRDFTFLRFSESHLSQGVSG